MVDLDFGQEFRKHARHLDFQVLGFLTAGDLVYPIGTDTKVLSTAFELIVRPILIEIAIEHDIILFEPSAQNHYPDFTLMESPEDPRKLAIDVKTTYRRFRKNGEAWSASFTLGGYTSFIRSDTKNIAFPFPTYNKHFIIGFIYSRNTESNLTPVRNENRRLLSSPVSDVEWFVQEKYRISSERAGSGNTTNIGSIVGSSLAEFSEGNGPFSLYEESVFVEYWRNYSPRAEDRKYTDIAGYFDWINAAE